MKILSKLRMIILMIPLAYAIGQNPRDAWNYTYYRSTDPGGPVYNWIDITSTGTVVTGLTDDNHVGPFTMGFSFPYYWYDFNTFQVGANGYITPGNQTSNFSPPFSSFPNVAAPNDLMAALAGDLVFSGQPGAQGTCYYWTNDIDSLVVSYIGVTEWEATIDTSATHTFQIILVKGVSEFDARIVFQYGEQSGSFSQPNNTTLAIGWENQTGQIGLTYGFSATPPHAFMPVEGLAVKIVREPIVENWTDAALIGGFGAQNLSKALRPGVPTSVSAVVRNVLMLPFQDYYVTHEISKSGQVVLADSVLCSDTLYPQQAAEIVFPNSFTALETGFYVATFRINVEADEYPDNDVIVTEMNSIALETGASVELAVESDLDGGSLSWQNGDAIAVSMAVPQDSPPLRVDSVLVKCDSLGGLMTVEIMEDSDGTPGQVLASRTMTMTGGWNRISFVDSSAIIVSGGEEFFIAVGGNGALKYETAEPISYRLWAYHSNNGWNRHPYHRSRDVMVRAIVTPQVENHVKDSKGQASFALLQNRPNPFNPLTTIEYFLPRRDKVDLRIFNVLGQPVRQLVDGEENKGRHRVTWDGRDNLGRTVSTGVYVCRLRYGAAVKTAKMTLIR